MFQPLHTIRNCTAVLVGVVLALPASLAHAGDPDLPAIRLGSPPPGITQCRGQVYNLVVYRDGGRYAIPVHAEVKTRVQVHSGLVNSDMATAEADGFKIDKHGDDIEAWAKEGTEEGTRTPAKIRSHLFSATLDFVATDDKLEPPDHVNIWHISEKEAYELEVAEAAEKRATEMTEERLLEELRDPFVVLQEAPVHVESGTMRITLEGGGRLGKRAYFPFTVWNMDDPEDGKPIQIARVQVFDKNRQRDFVARVTKPPTESARESGIAVEVLPGQEYQGNIAVADADKLVPPFEIVFTDANTGAPIVASVERYQPPSMPIEKYNRMWRQRDRFKQTSVNVRLLGGAVWLSDRTPQQELAAAGVSGLALRVQKGYHWGGAIEGEIMGGRSGEATFEQTNWNGTQGDITRQASFGRAVGYVAMRFGYAWIFTGRVGIGLQGVNYNSTFQTANGSDDGPGDGFELDGVLAVGSSLDARFGTNWSVGAALNFTTTFFSEGTRVFEAGLNIGYGWM